MYLHTTQVLAALAGFLALTTANPLNLDAAPAALDKRACPADCNNQYPLARKLGQPCGGDCDKTYRAGATTCSCNLGAIVSLPPHGSPYDFILFQKQNQKQNPSVCVLLE